MTVIPREIRSPDFAGNTNTRNVIQAMRAHGTTRFMMKNLYLRRIKISNLMVLCVCRWIGYCTWKKKEEIFDEWNPMFSLELLNVLFNHNSNRGVNHSKKSVRIFFIVIFYYLIRHSFFWFFMIFCIKGIIDVEALAGWLNLKKMF